MAEIVIPDFVNTLAQANNAASRVNDIRQQNALAGYYRDNGQALLSGDQNALAGLAQYDPQAAFVMQRQLQADRQAAEDRAWQQQTRAEDRAWRMEDRAWDRERIGRQDARQERMDARADEEWRLKVDEYARTRSQQEREAEAAQIEQAVQQGLGMDEATWNATMAAQAPELVGRWADREQIARSYMSIAEQLKGMQPAAPMSGPGKVQADINAGYLPEGTPLRGEGQQIKIDMGGGPKLGSLSTDYGYVLGEDGQPKIDPATGLPTAAAVPGSPAALEAAQAAQKADLTGQTKAVSSDVVMNAADKARNVIGKTSTGTLGRGLAYIGETDAAEVQRQIATMKANATIETLTAMRQASPTGGALGSVTEKEGAMLAAKLGALDPSAGPTRFREQLDDYERAYLRTIHGPKVGDAIYEQSRGQEKSGGEDGGIPSVSSDADYDALPSGATFRDPNGVMRRKP